MKTYSLNISALVFFLFLASPKFCHAQTGRVEVNQDPKIATLLNLKKQMNKSDVDSDRYKIQIYNGNRSGAYDAEKEFKKNFPDWATKVVYEQPNFKTWIGSFRTRLEADRALKEVKKKFSNAFIFKPK
ncbi:SPOR domain-containing protein [Gaetbulibacter aestuarii]|uniref:SPOR domain-containing protein n=1 Tax=Gaetbulibacter aestuarii TaxID=1502358 RepID=A0ABW7N0L4_9FLAO